MAFIEHIILYLSPHFKTCLSILKLMLMSLKEAENLISLFHLSTYTEASLPIFFLIDGDDDR